MAILPSGTIFANINSDIADNNAGEISAYDIRHNMVDMLESINHIVARGNFDSNTPFIGSDVRASITNGDHGAFIAESGVIFPYGTNGGRQLIAYPGPSGISHNELDDLTDGDPHLQYVNINGSHKMTGNFATGNEWINASGATGLASTDDRGIQFEYVNSNKEVMHVGEKTTIKFDIDDSTMLTGKGLAQAWITFNGSGNMSIMSSYNVQKLQRTGSPGKFKVFFKSGTFNDANYVAIANSNSRSDSDNPEDFDVNTVGLVERNKDYITFYVLNDAGNYVNAAVNDLVVFGNASGVSADATPTIEIL